MDNTDNKYFNIWFGFGKLKKQRQCEVFLGTMTRGRHGLFQYLLWANMNLIRFRTTQMQAIVPNATPETLQPLEKLCKF